tara:strand:- start:1788 stop:2645 length:858 start_codon:yes stop_codon:yes gene_type:complete
MMNLNWLAIEAQKLHAIFQNAFFGVITLLLLIAVVLDFFKIPMGNSPGISTLVGRCLIATLLLVALPEIMNSVASITDSIAHEIGDLNNFKIVLSRMGEKLKSLAWSWTSVKDMVILVVSFLSFFILYISVFFADAAFLYAWTLIYVFSPIILALYVLPVTAGATTAMFKSMIEISLWKIVWAAMSALLWSTALSDINNPEHQIDFLTAIVLNLMLALSVLMTPTLVRSLFSSGVSGVASGLQNTLMAATALTPTGVTSKLKAASSFSGNRSQSRSSNDDPPKPK